MNIRNRIIEYRTVDACELRPNPKNWRTHPKPQRDALLGVLAEVGIADAVLARKLPDGSLMLIDGHLRAETMPDQKIPVLVLDVDESEADKLLATLDPLAAMADSDAVKLDALLRSVDTGSEALQQLLSSTAGDAGLYAGVPDPTDEDEQTEEAPQQSGVRMVQLFFDASNIAEFQGACQKIAEACGSENITDTVLEGVRRASASL